MTFSLSKILHSLTALCLLLNLSACGGVETASWTEEVRLHDGRFIEVSRKVMAKKGGMLSDAGFGGLVGFELKYAPMGVEWKGPWGLSPISFEIFDGVPHLVLFIKDPQYCANKADAEYSAKFMRWRNGQWEEMSQADFPLDKATMNLYNDYTVGHFGKDPTKGRITWDKKSSYTWLNGRDAPTDPRDLVKSWFGTGNNCKRFEHVRNINK
jgi:hypothetical protein